MPRGKDEQLPVGCIVAAYSARDRAADKTIVSHAPDGVYRTQEHLAELARDRDVTRDPNEITASHVRRLEALHHAGMAERIANGVWTIPPDLVHRGRTYDAAKLAVGNFELQFHLPLAQHVRAIGATRLGR